MDELVLYRQSTGGEWKIYRHSGFFNTKWRQVYATNDEGKASEKYKRIHDRLRQGGVRLVDPEGVVIQEFNPGPMTLRWGPYYAKPSKKSI
jgi:hypothetical protein